MLGGNKGDGYTVVAAAAVKGNREGTLGLCGSGTSGEERSGGTNLQVKSEKVVASISDNLNFNCMYVNTR